VGPTGRAALLEGQPANVLSGNPYFPRQAHSSPHMQGHMGVVMRGGMPNAIKDNHSIPAFPTQPMLSQAVPTMPGLGMRNVNQDLGPRHPSVGTTNHTGLAIRQGMASQPRHARVQSEASPHPGMPLHQQVQPSWQTAHLRHQVGGLPCLAASLGGLLCGGSLQHHGILTCKRGILNKGSSRLRCKSASRRQWPQAPGPCRI